MDQALQPAEIKTPERHMVKLPLPKGPDNAPPLVLKPYFLAKVSPEISKTDEAVLAAGSGLLRSMIAHDELLPPEKSAYRFLEVSRLPIATPQDYRELNVPEEQIPELLNEDVLECNKQLRSEGVGHLLHVTRDAWVQGDSKRSRPGIHMDVLPVPPGAAQDAQPEYALYIGPNHDGGSTLNQGLASDIGSVRIADDGIVTYQNPSDLKYHPLDAEKATRVISILTAAKETIR